MDKNVPQQALLRAALDELRPLGEELRKRGWEVDLYAENDVVINKHDERRLVASLRILLPVIPSPDEVDIQP